MIYSFEIRRYSYATVAVEADSKDEAGNILTKWRDNIKNQEELDMVMDDPDREQTKVYLDPLKESYTDEEFARADFVPDFEIRMKEKEPRYDLYLIMDEEPCHVKRKVFQDVDMSMLLWYLNHYNTSYILKRECPAWECASESLKNGRSAIAYKCTKRKD